MEIEMPRVDVSAEQGDYLENGILYCGKCRTPKQVRISLLGKEKIMGCMCDCESERLREQKKADERKARMERIERLRCSGFSDKTLAECRFEYDDGGNPYLTEIAKNFVENFPDMKASGEGLIFCGGVGTGKTFMASCIANALIDQGVPCLVTNFLRIIDDISGTWEGRQEYVKAFNRYDLLVIDDFGVERDTEFAEEIVYRVIDSRIRSGLPMILTTNLLSLESSSIRKQRLYSRIEAMCLPVLVNGKDRRRHRIDSGLVSKIYGK